MGKSLFLSICIMLLRSIPEAQSISPNNLTFSGCFIGLGILKEGELCIQSNSSVIQTNLTSFFQKNPSNDSSNATSYVYSIFQDIPNHLNDCNGSSYQQLSNNLKLISTTKCKNWPTINYIENSIYMCNGLDLASESYSIGNFSAFGSHICSVFITAYMNYTPANLDDQRVYYIILPICVLSFASCVFIIALYCIYPEIRDYERKLICILSFLDGIVNVITFLSGVIYPKDAVCTAQGIFIQIFTLSGIIWTGIIATVLYFACKNERIYTIPIVRTLIGVLGFTTFTSVIPFAWHTTEVYAAAGGWCWFPATAYGEKFGLFYILTFVIIIWCTYAYCYIRSRTRLNFVNLNMFFPKLKYYPIILFICLVPLMLARLFEIFFKIPFEYVLWSAVCIRMLGFFNALAYGYTNEIKIVRKDRT